MKELLVDARFRRDVLEARYNPKTDQFDWFRGDEQSGSTELIQGLGFITEFVAPEWAGDICDDDFVLLFAAKIGSLEYELTVVKSTGQFMLEVVDPDDDEWGHVDLPWLRDGDDVLYDHPWIIHREFREIVPVILRSYMKAKVDLH